MIDLRELIKAGVHFGHQASRWHPKMKPYIWGTRNGVHLIDVSKVAINLDKAAQFLENTAAEKKSILLVGTKKPARTLIQDAAMALGLPYVTHRWIGGTLTNASQVKKSIARLMHHEQLIATTNREFSTHTKKELNIYHKIVNRLKNNVGGIQNLTWPLGAIMLVDVRKEKSARLEAMRIGIPIVAIVDTNNDPSGIDCVIPANDDSPRALKIIIDYLQAAIERGLQRAKNSSAEAATEQASIAETTAPEATAAEKLTEQDEEDVKNSKKKKAADRPTKESEPAAAPKTKQRPTTPSSRTRAGK